MTIAQTAEIHILEELGEIIDSHAMWLQSDGRNGRRANLSGMDLQGLNLRGVYLPEANFRSVNLRGVDLSGAVLSGADFSESTLESANLTDAKMDGANFCRTEGTGAYFIRTSLVNSNMTNANFNDADFAQARLAGSKCREMSCVRANFTYADLDCTILRYMHATEANFESANLQQADCRDALFNYANFKDANVASANFRKANLDHVSFSHANFSKALELDPAYHIRSIEEEKRSVREELKNLQSMREEIGMFEHQINEQKKQIVLKRKVFDGLNDLEKEVGKSLTSYMKIFRMISVFWFTVVASVTTLLLYRLSSVGIGDMKTSEITVTAALLVGVLGAHCMSAILSHNVSRKFASYVRMRHEKLGLLEKGQTINVKTGTPPIHLNLGGAHTPRHKDTAEDPQMLYL